MEQQQATPKTAEKTKAAKAAITHCPDSAFRASKRNVEFSLSISISIGYCLNSFYKRNPTMHIGLLRHTEYHEVYYKAWCRQVPVYHLWQ